MMKVFLTGGTGFIGSRVAKALVADGHAVTALSRRSGTDLEKLNVKVVQGSLNDVDVIAAAATDADAVLHLGFEHDFTRYQECCEQDLTVVKAIVNALSGTGKLFVNTIGITGGPSDVLSTEDTPAKGPRAESENITVKANNSGIRGVVLRLPPFVYRYSYSLEDWRSPSVNSYEPTEMFRQQTYKMFVYSKNFSFFYDVMYKAAEQKGSSSYIGAGDNKMSVVHVDDAAKAYLALLSHKNAHGIYNVPGQNGVTAKDIAEIIATKLQCKAESVSMDEAKQLFGPIVALRTSINSQVDGSKIKRDLDWKPQYTDIKVAI